MGTNMGTITTPVGSDASVSDDTAVETEVDAAAVVAEGILDAVGDVVLDSVGDVVLDTVGDVVLDSVGDVVLDTVGDVVLAMVPEVVLGTSPWWRRRCVGMDQSALGVGVHAGLMDGVGPLVPSLNHHDP